MSIHQRRSYGRTCASWFVIAVATLVFLQAAEARDPSREREGEPGASIIAGSVPVRIVSMPPSVTETIFFLGRGDLLVGVSDFCTYPPETGALPKVGGYINPNFERLTSLRPDLIIVQGRNERMEGYCRQRGIALLHTHMDNLEAIDREIAGLGRLLNCEERAGELRRTLREELDAVTRQVKGRARKKVFVCLWRTPGSMSSMSTVGGTSFVTEVVRMAGGDNIFEDLTRQYPEASKETLLRRAPEVILELRIGERLSPSDRERIIEEWKVFRGIPAVESKRVYVITEDYALVPGPRMGAAARLFAEMLHPEVRHDR